MSDTDMECVQICMELHLGCQNLSKPEREYLCHPGSTPPTSLVVEEWRDKAALASNVKPAGAGTLWLKNHSVWIWVHQNQVGTGWRTSSLSGLIISLEPSVLIYWIHEYFYLNLYVNNAVKSPTLWWWWPQIYSWGFVSYLSTKIKSEHQSNSSVFVFFLYNTNTDCDWTNPQVIYCYLASSLIFYPLKLKQRMIDLWKEAG